jgi:hypothetical protein
VTGYGPPDDPSEAPTGLYNYGHDGDEQPEPGSTPWYRRRAALIGLSALVAILLAVVIYEIVDLTHTGGSTTPSTSPTTSAAVTTTPPAPPTTTLTEVPTTSAETTAAPTTTPPPSTSIDDGRHHHRHRDGTP